MKVAIIGPAHPLRPGGITSFNERLCRAFLDEGHEASIWSFSLQYPAMLFPGSSQFTDAPAPEGLRIHSTINSINPYTWLKTGNAIAAEKPDLVVVRYWLPFMAPALGTVLKRIRKKYPPARIVCIADNILPHEQRPGDKTLTAFFVKTVDDFIVMSKNVLEDLRRFSAKPARLVPHPLYDHFGPKTGKQEAREYLSRKLHKSIGEDDRIVLFFGLVRAYKGLELLLEAIRLLRRENIRLMIAGEYYEEEAKYAPWLEDPQMEPLIIPFTQFVSNTEVKYFFCASDLVVQPYKSATQSGVTPVAYHFDKPMVVTNVGGLPEMVPNGVAGLVCDPDPRSIAEAIREFFNLGEDYFLEGIRHQKEEMSWSHFVEVLAEKPVLRDH